MRRIVVIAAGMSGISCAVRIKYALPGCEINLVSPIAIYASNSRLTAGKSPPAPVWRQGFDGKSLQSISSVKCSSLAENRLSAGGPAGKRCAADWPDPEFLNSHDIAVLEAQGITPDLARQEISLSSSRGKLTIRYTDLVVEVPATVRLPRALQRAENVYCWPASGFAARPEAIDAALDSAGKRGSPVVVTGDGPFALEAVFLVREAGLRTTWLRTGEKGVPAMEPHLLALALGRLGPDVDCVHLPDLEARQLACRLEGSRLESITWPGGRVAALSCCLWTSPLMAGHPLLREDGIFLDAFGRIGVPEEGAGQTLHLMGSGAALPAALLADESIQAPIFPGGKETAGLSIDFTLARLLESSGECRQAIQGALGAQSVSTRGLCFCRAGFDLAAAQGMKLEAERSVVSSLSMEQDSPEQSRLVLALTGDRKSRTLLGLQVLGLGEGAGAAENLFSLGLAGLADGTRLTTLARRGWFGSQAGLLGQAARILDDRFESTAQGISPDELLASRAAGAEFFTLDLRSPAEWAAGHLPEACNIPLGQLKKRLQDEVPRFTPLVLACATGLESHAVAARLAALGATDLYVLDGGMDVWPYPL